MKDKIVVMQDRHGNKEYTTYSQMFFDILVVVVAFIIVFGGLSLILCFIEGLL